MKDLIVRNKLIQEDPIKILEDIQSNLSNGKLSYFRVTGGNIAVPCPHHSEGLERHCSCYLNLDNDSVDYLKAHCFTCGSIMSFPKFVGECFDRSESFGAKWLIEHYNAIDINDEPEIILKRIEFPKQKEIKFLDESVLDSFVNYHPYMTKRKLTSEVINKFQIKYDPETKCLVFPVRDIKGRLKFLTRRSVEGKKFIIDKGAEKSDIYLLNEANDYDTVVVVESQINALTLWGWGYPAIALFGAGTPYEQLETLNKSNINHYILCYDNDPAGLKGSKQFKKYIRKDVLIDTITVPSGKDVNDLTKEEFDDLLKNSVW